MFERCRMSIHRKVFFTMGNEETIRVNGEQTGQTNDDARSALSRRQISLGLPGILLAGTI